MCWKLKDDALWRRQFNYSNWHKINKEAISLGWSTLCLMCGWGVRTPVKLIFRVSCWWCLCIVVVVCTQLIIRQDFSLWYSHNSVLCTCSWGSAEILVKYRNWNHRWSENFKPYHLILFLILFNTSPLLVSVIGIPLSFPHILNKNEMDQNGQKWIKMDKMDQNGAD